MRFLHLALASVLLAFVACAEGDSNFTNVVTSGTITAGSTLAATGATTLSSTLAVTGAATMSSTLGVTGVATFSDAVTLSDGATIDQSANNKITFAENSEDIEMTFGTNLCTFASTTGATVAFTPAVAFADAVSLSDGAVIDQSANNKVEITENSEDLQLTFAANSVTLGSSTSAVLSLATIDTIGFTEADLAAGACTAGTIRIDNAGTRELCICNAGGTAYDCVSFTTANGPSD